MQRRARLLGALLLVGCGERSTAGPVDYDQLDPAARAQEAARRDASRALPVAPDAALAWTEQAASEAGRGLKKRLQSAMKAGGPVEAVVACNLQAPTVVADVAEIRGVTVGRASLRLRNPANAQAPAWVAAWLDTHGSKPVGAGPAVAEVVSTGEATAVARVLRPLPVEPVCLTCHGPRETVAAPVRERIAALYPDDNALGYAVGDLRGVLWAEYSFSPEP